MGESVQAGSSPSRAESPVPPRMRLSGVRARVRAVPGGVLIWRIGVTAVGVLVIAIGVLLLPLPGPGWLVIFAGLGLLATEYAWAARLLGWLRGHVLRSTRWATRQAVAVRVVLGVGALVFLLAVVLGTWWLYTII